MSLTLYKLFVWGLQILLFKKLLKRIKANIPRQKHTPPAHIRTLEQSMSTSIKIWSFVWVFLVITPYNNSIYSSGSWS